MTYTVRKAGTSPETWKVLRVEGGQELFAAQFADETDAWMYLSLAKGPSKSLRDEFAMAALVAILSTARDVRPEQADQKTEELFGQQRSIWAYAYADAMLRERLR